MLRHLRDIHQSVQRELIAAKQRSSAPADRHRRDLQFKVGDQVRVSTAHLSLPAQPSSKFRPRFLGPFTITHVISPVAYRLALPPSMARVHPVFHVSRLLPWTPNDDQQFPLRVIPQQPTPLATDPLDALTDVITAARLGYTSKLKPTVLFHVRWAASRHRPPSWEPYSALQDSDFLIDYLLSPEWKEFRSSDAFIRFAHKFPELVPRIVRFDK